MTIINVMASIFLIISIGDIIFYFLYHWEKISLRFIKAFTLTSVIYDFIFALLLPIIAIMSPIENQNNSSKSPQIEPYYYQMTATAVNENTFVTEDGNMWRMKNITIEKGKKYQLTFDNRDTEIITDDEIIDFIELNEKVD